MYSLDHSVSFKCFLYAPFMFIFYFFRFDKLHANSKSLKILFKKIQILFPVSVKWFQVKKTKKQRIFYKKFILLIIFTIIKKILLPLDFTFDPRSKLYLSNLQLLQGLQNNIKIFKKVFVIKNNEKFYRFLIATDSVFYLLEALRAVYFPQKLLPDD